MQTFYNGEAALAFRGLFKWKGSAKQDVRQREKKKPGPRLQAVSPFLTKRPLFRTRLSAMSLRFAYLRLLV